MLIFNKSQIRIYLNVLRTIVLKYPIFKNIFLKVENLIYNPFTNFEELLNYKINHSQNLYEKILENIRNDNKNYSFKDKVILEIGPGNTLLLASIFILNGADRVYLVDSYKQIFNDSLNSILYNQIIKKLQSKHHIHDIKDFQAIKGKIIYFSNNPIETFNQLRNSSVDLIFSNAVLEHVSELNLTIKKISMLLKQGGYTFHHIDLKDHYHTNDKCYLNFLKYSDRIWNFIGNTNRIRYSEFITLFGKNKFDILEIEQHKTKSILKIKEIKPNFNKRFRNINENDLSILDFNILAKRL